MYQPGDWVVFRVCKVSNRPGKRAKEIEPTSHGELYVYDVDKYWVVTDIQQDQLTVKTRTGKTHLINADSDRLRPANWWERLFYRHRFPTCDQPQSDSGPHRAVG